MTFERKESKERKSLNEFAEIYSEMTGREYVTSLNRPDWSARMSNAKIRNKIKARKELGVAIETFLKNGGIIKKFQTLKYNLLKCWQIQILFFAL